MEFGRVQEGLADIDFTLPPDTEGTRRTLEATGSAEELKVYVGASKWGEKTWAGKIYPPKTPDKEFLSFYAKSFNAVEAGATFYATPSPDQLSKWAQQVTYRADFKFCPRFPQKITHIRKLVNTEEETAQFLQSMTAFGQHLGPLVLLLGENFSPKLFPQLKAYLTSLPPSIKVAVEVRNKNWFSQTESRDALFELLRELNIGTVISDTAGRRDAVHMELTTGEAIIRFVGNDLDPSDFTRLDEWVDRLQSWKSQGLRTVWFFMHQNNEKYAPEACDYLIKCLNEKLGSAVRRPQFVSLF